MRQLLSLVTGLLVAISATAGDNNAITENSNNILTAAEVAAVSGSISVERVVGSFVGDTGTFTFQLKLEIDHIDPPYGTKWSGFSNGFVISSPDGASFENLNGQVSDTLLEGWGGAISVTTWADGSSPDSIAFKTTGQPKKFLSAGAYSSALAVSVLLHRADRGKQVCLDSLSMPPLYEWKWGTNEVVVMRPQWGGKYCFFIEALNTITATAGPNGTISPAGTLNIPSGTDQSFTISPDPGYHVAGVEVDGTPIGPVSSYTFVNVTDNHSINATFLIDTLVIQASSSANGTISPEGAVNVLYGTDQTFTMTPEGEGYLVDIFVDGASVGPNSTYTFSGVSANHTILALFNDSTFLPTQQYSADIMFLLTSDFDQDNFTDIIYSTSGIAPPAIGGLWVAFGKQGGTFEAPVRLHNARRTPMALGFINADTLIDLVAVGGVDGQQIYTLLSHEDRSFSIDSIPYVGAIANSIVSGYFNGDSFVDFLLGNGSIIYGNISGRAPQEHLVLDAVSLNAADFNIDGFTDLAVGQGDSILILLSDGIGSFSQSTSLFTGHNLSPIPPTRAVADLDNDGVPDIASVVLIQEAPEPTSLVIVGFGDGHGGFKLEFSKVVSGYAVNAQIADVDRDHYLDLVSSCGTNPEQRVIVLYGDGAGGFPRLSETQYPSASGSTLAITTGDLDRDGNPDFVTGAYQGPGPITVMYSTPPDAQVLTDEMVVTVYAGVDGSDRMNRGSRSGSSQVNVEVTNPDEYVISSNSTTIAGSFYWQLDADGNLVLDDRTVDYNLAEGEYRIVVRAVPGADNTVYNVGVGIDGSQQSAMALGGNELNGGAATSLSDSVIFYYRIEAIPAINPQSGYPTSNAQPIISWNLLFPRLPASTTYDFQLSDYTDFRSLIDDVQGLTTPEHLVSRVLGRNDVYYWRARPVIDGQPGEWSHHYALFISSGCCAGVTGNVDCDAQNVVDISDLTRMIDYLYVSFAPLCCTSEANVDGLDGIDNSDLTALIQNLYSDPEYRVNVDCPQ